MDYEFYHDDKNEPFAEFSMGHEAIARWINQEIGNNQDKATALLNTIEQLNSGKLPKYEQRGKELKLRIKNSEVSIIDCIDNHHDKLDEDLRNGTSFYGQETNSECGLEDFKAALESWLEYITE